MNREKLLQSCSFQTATSGGPGGQHANRTETKVILRFPLRTDELLNEKHKERLLAAFASRLTNEGVLVLSCSETRSQAKNKEIVINRFFNLLETYQKPEKKRKPTKKPRAAHQKRLQRKKMQSEKKQNRKRPDF